MIDSDLSFDESDPLVNFTRNVGHHTARSSIAPASINTHGDCLVLVYALHDGSSKNAERLKTKQLENIEKCFNSLTSLNSMSLCSYSKLNFLLKTFS